MKTFAVILSLFLSLSAQALTVQKAKYNSETNALDILVSYGGGCKEHSFRLEIGSCLETYPVSCPVTLVDLTVGDYCEALVSQEVSIPLKDAGLDDSYFNGAGLRFENTDVGVQLPFVQ